MSDKKTFKVIQVASGNGRKPGQQATLIGLGLNKIGRERFWKILRLLGVWSARWPTW